MSSKACFLHTYSKYDLISYFLFLFKIVNIIFTRLMKKNLKLVRYKLSFLEQS